MRRIAAALAFLGAGFISACATAPSSETIAFSSAQATDSLSVKLLDPDGADARAQFTVQDASGRTLYEDAVSLSVLGYEKPLQPWTKKLARDRLWLKSVPLSEMEGDLVQRAQKGVGAFWPIADNDALERAKKSGRPVLCYVSAPDGVTCAWYDDAIPGGVSLIEGAS